MRVLTQNISSLKSQAKREKIAAYYSKEISKNNDFTFFLETHLDPSDEEDLLVSEGIPITSTSPLPMESKGEWFS